MFNKNTCFSDCIDFDVSNMLFAEAKETEFKPPSGGAAMKNFRITIGTKNADKTFGELVFALNDSYSFGISTNTGKKDDTAGSAPQPDAGETFGHSLSLCLTNKENPTPEQLGFVKTLERIIEHSKKHLVSVRRSIREFDLKLSELKPMNKLIYRKRDKETGEVVDKYGPMIYPKLIETHKDGGKIYTEFYDLDDEFQKLIDPRSLIGTSCYVRPVIKVEGIWIGSKNTRSSLNCTSVGSIFPPSLLTASFTKLFAPGLIRLLRWMRAQFKAQLQLQTTSLRVEITISPSPRLPPQSLALPLLLCTFLLCLYRSCNSL